MGAEKIWLIWLILAAIFFIAEMFTAGFFLFWFSIGALAAAILALFFKAGVIWQWVAFVLVSGVLLTLSRRFAEKVSRRQPAGIGADRVVGKIGIVRDEIDSSKGRGNVLVDSEEWRAESASGEVIPAGAKVKVLRVEGTHVVVEKVKEEKI